MTHVTSDGEEIALVLSTAPSVLSGLVVLVLQGRPAAAPRRGGRDLDQPEVLYVNLPARRQIGSAWFSSIPSAHWVVPAGSMTGMKLSVSLPDADVEFLDAYAQERARASRSAVVHEAIEALRLKALPDAYGSAWAEWEESGEGQLWERAAGDGI